MALKTSIGDFYFYHPNLPAEELLREFNIDVGDNEWRRTTVVKLIDRFNRSEICNAVSVCHRKDNFNKKIGRKMALTNALKMLKLPKQKKTEIWENYKKQFGL